MIYIKLLSIGGSAALSSWIPQLIFVPYGILLWCIDQGFNPRLLVAMGTMGGTLGSLAIRVLDGYIDPRLQKYFNPQSKKFRLPSRAERLIHWDDSSSHPLIWWFLIIFLAVTSPVPDLVTVRYVRKRVSFGQFLSVVMFSKFFVYFPFVFGITSVVQLLEL